MPYDVPGRADELGADLLEAWNAAIERAYDEQPSELKSRFFELDPERLAAPQGTDAVKWPGDPAEPSFCIDERAAQTLSDWGSDGRHALQNEYCEYAVVHARDVSGRQRPKRVQVTTELRELWSCVARRDPERVREMAADALGAAPSLEELFGVPDPVALDEDAREVAFGHAVAGHGNDGRLIQAGVPAQPTGRLNTDNALFMTHPINGLDDLVYIVLFGARPYARRSNGTVERASRDEIFSAFGVEHLACRHADPAAALGAYGAAFEGRQVAVADPLGMYLREPDPVLRQSHVQRANHHQRPPADPGTRRVFRQGYEWDGAAPGFRAGLNFVSFQDTPERLIRMLTAGGWLGGVNFGGAPEANDLAALLSVYAAAIYFAPPLREGEAFPGAEALGLALAPPQAAPEPAPAGAPGGG